MKCVLRIFALVVSYLLGFPLLCTLGLFVFRDLPIYL